MPIVPIILTLALVGFLCWLVLQIPMPEIFRKVIIGVMILLVILWLLSMFGVNTGIGYPRLGR